jgi:hypothetical protein
MRIQNVLAVVLALVLSPTVVARAEGPQPGQPGQPVIVDPNTQQQVVADPNAQYAQPQPQPVPDASGNVEAQQGRGIEYGAYLLVPIFLTNPSGRALDSGPIAASPGIGVVGRIGWEFGGGLTLELTLGGHANNLSTDESGVTRSATVTNIFGGAGVRYSFLNASALVPFLGAGLQLNFWGSDNASDGTVSTTNDYAALGLNGVAGLAYELSVDLAIEAGVRADFTTQPKNPAGEAFFEQGQLTLSPFFGATLYY